MPDLKAQFFAGSGDIPSDWADRLQTPSIGLGLRDKLTALHWDGSAAAVISLVTSTDGARVTGGSFSLWGPLSADTIEFPASKLWEGTERTAKIQIRNLMGQAFTFSGGMLHSEYIDMDTVEFGFSRNNQPVLPADWSNAGFGEFALRCFAHIDKTSNKQTAPRVKFTVLAAPLSCNGLNELSELTDHAAWPGIKILEGTADLFPRPPSDALWGAPIFPIICTRDRATGCTAIPSGPHLRFAIAEIMRSATVPTACTARGALNQRGQLYLDGAAEPELRGPTTTWPPVDRPAPDQGNNVILYKLSRITRQYDNDPTNNNGKRVILNFE